MTSDAPQALEIFAQADLPTQFGEFQIVAFRRDGVRLDDVALVRGNVKGRFNVPVRVAIAVSNSKPHNAISPSSPKPSSSICAKKVAASASPIKSPPIGSKNKDTIPSMQTSIWATTTICVPMIQPPKCYELWASDLSISTRITLEKSMAFVPAASKSSGENRSSSNQMHSTTDIFAQNKSKAAIC